MEELAELVINKEDVRVEDSDSQVDLTPLVVSKALIKYMRAGNLLPKDLKRWIKKQDAKTVIGDLQDIEEDEEESFPYLPAEIRLIQKALEYLDDVTIILQEEAPYNKKLHDEFYRTCIDFKKKLETIQKKHGIP